MNLFEKTDLRFVELTADTSQREAAIAELTRIRGRVFWSALLLTVSAILTTVSGGNSVGGAVIGMSAAVSWGVVWKYESDLRLLMVIRALKGSWPTTE
jgi:hypothetical protein